MFHMIKYLRRYSSTQNKEILKLLAQISKDKFEFKYIRSSAPGGQNVNKLNTKVELRFNVNRALWLPEYVRSKLLVQEKNSINKHGNLVLTSEKTRSQHHNVYDVMEKVRKMVEKAAYVREGPSEDELLVIEERLRRGNEKRLLNKKFKSMKKSDRKNID